MGQYRRTAIALRRRIEPWSSAATEAGKTRHPRKRGTRELSQMRRLDCGGLHARIVRDGVPAMEAISPGIPPFVERARKSTRLNSSHSSISYAVFCLKKK